MMDFPPEDTCIEGTPIEGAHVGETVGKTRVGDLPVDNAHVIKNRQRYLMWGIGAIVVGGIIIYGWVAMRDTPLSKKQEFKSSLLTGSSRINPQEAWVYKFGTEAEIAKKRLDAMEEMLSKILKMAEASQRDTSQKEASQKDISSAARIENLREDLNSAKNDMNATRSKPGEELPSSSGTFLPLPPGSLTSQAAHISGDYPLTGMQGSSPSSKPFRSKAIRKISLSLRNARSNMPLKTVDNTVPAGAFAKAILLGGVDASASIQASSDPRPALLRITDPGTLPRKFRSDLKGCHALAACYGDISSERVFMRLEKLTCIERKTGEIVEVKVQGYVAGEDGRTGIRGSVVDRAGESMRNVLMGGFLGGVGEFLSQSKSAVTFSPVAGLAQANPMGMGEMLKAGAGKGINNALEKYADFYIKRAEQLQPVIQVAAGRQVDIVFTEGVPIGDSIYRQAIGRSNDQGRYHQIQSMNEETHEPQPTVSDWVNNGDANHK